MTKKSLILQNLKNLGNRKLINQRVATNLVLLSSILPFLNNILRNFFDTQSFILVDFPGAKTIDLDSAIFFLAMPISYLFIAIGGRYGAYKKSYYAVYVSCYFQLFLLVNFIFIKKEKAYFLTQIFLFIIFFVVGILLVFMDKYYTTIEKKNEFLNETIDRYASIIKNKK